MDQYAELKALEEWPGVSGTRGGYCQWTPTQDGKGLEWDGGEKFYDYADCLRWLIRDKFKPWGVTVSGSVTWKGEERDDRGTLSVADGAVTAERTRRFPKGLAPLEVARLALELIVNDRDDEAAEIASEALKVLKAKGEK